MHIANPIYDVVFKYLMEDEAAAKLIIGTIIDEEIESLEFEPREQAVLMHPYAVTVHRMDFSARIRQPDGTHKQVIIEIQKAKYPSDILRFRRYLARQYQDENNSYTVETVQNGKPHSETRYLHIIAIYFLGYPLEYTDAPVIKVSREYIDVTTGASIPKREVFIEELSHDSFVIQIPHLRPQRRTEVEQLLMVFDQRWRWAKDGQILDINEADYPAQYAVIMRRLQKAAADSELRETMEAEEEILQNFVIQERRMAELTEALAEKDRLIAELQRRLQGLE